MRSDFPASQCHMNQLLHRRFFQVCIESSMRDDVYEERRTGLSGSKNDLSLDVERNHSRSSRTMTLAILSMRVSELQAFNLWIHSTRPLFSQCACESRCFNWALSARENSINHAYSCLKAAAVHSGTRCCTQILAFVSPQPLYTHSP
ncbi:hypothetical protein A0H81_10089 [Grifola frondosa]|uniref:Uncharacterized protein n=1 Tax=Grifola frondosa TaxID=5627 RepID=A0A1C7LZD3_GRIFR|nr:hypothetical protein A0H81_10089 [Grifola frondosa]